MKSLGGRVAFVTGGASGIGLGIVRAMLDRGVRVMLADLRPDYIDEAKAFFGDRPDVAFLQVDVIDRDAMAAAADAVVAKFGAVHILVNNAGVGATPAVEQMQYSDWDWVLGVNLGGTINGVMSFLPHMIRQGEGGHIVSTASMAALLPSLNSQIYAASKYAVRGLSDALRLTLAPYKIGVSVLYPGLTVSRMLRSEENRHARFGRIAEGAPHPGPGESPPDAGMDPRDVGEAVVEGILANRGYILSHGEFRDELAEHFEEILASSPAGQAIDPGRFQMEEMRRRQTEAAMQVIKHMDD